MRLVPLGRSAVVLSVLLVPALAGALAAPADTRPDVPRPADKVRQDLARPITLKIENKPLSAAIDALNQAARMTVVLDAGAVQIQLGVTADQTQPISLDLDGVPVRKALRRILEPFDLTYVVIDDAVIATTEDAAMSRQMHQHISVDVDKVDLATALRQMARDAGVNVLLDARAEKDADAKLTLHLDDVPLETAVRLAAEMANLKPVRVGNVLFVTSKDNANEMRQDPDLTQPAQPGPILKDK